MRGELLIISLQFVREISKESNKVLFKPCRYVIDKYKNRKYKIPDLMKMKTKVLELCMQNSSAASGKIFKVKNPETKYTVINVFNLWPFDEL